MQRQSDHRVLVLMASIAVVLVGCVAGGDAGPDGDGGVMEDPCADLSGEVPTAPPEGAICERLSSYGQISLDPEGNVVPNEGVLPYDLNTPLFSDHAKKTRTLWVPEGSAAEYTGDGTPFEFPEGTVITKTFSFPADMRAPDEDVRVIETRVLIRTDEGWEARPYIWNEEQTEAYYDALGGVFEVSWLDEEGDPRSTEEYLVPNRNQCIECHGVTDAETGRKVTMLIGPRAKHVNKNFDYGAFLPGDGVQNQLERWAEVGFLEGAPGDPTEAPAIVPYDETDPATLNERARGYLDANCAHCHNPYGAGQASGLMLMLEEDRPNAWGICQTMQRSVGEGVTRNIVPGDVVQSGLHARMDSTDAMVMMPRLGRSMIHDEGVELIREWIEWLGTPEADEQLGLSEAFENPCW